MYFTFSIEWAFKSLCCWVTKIMTEIFYKSPIVDKMNTHSYGKCENATNKAVEFDWDLLIESVKIGTFW